MFECDIAHRRSVAVLCMLFKIRCNQMLTFYGSLPLTYVQCGLNAVLRSHIGMLMRLLAAEPLSTAVLLFPSLCPCGIILLTLYSMVWDWRVSRAEPMFVYWHELLDPFLSSTVSPLLFFLSVGWCCMAGVFGLVDHSQPCTAYLF